MPRTLKVSDSSRGRRSVVRDGAADRLVARLLAADAAYAGKVAAVRRRQKRLRGRLNGPSWQLYLQLEEAEIGRWTHALDRVAQWALAQRPKSRKR